MRLVMRIRIRDSRYFSIETIPFEYSSVEDARVDFEKLVLNHFDSEDFVFAGHDFNISDFFEGEMLDLPEIITMEEWYITYG